MWDIALLLGVIAVAPFAVGLAMTGRSAAGLGANDSPRAVLSAALLCALAYNLIFFWQELWLVLPKALMPGLHPVLFHNDHRWSGESEWTGLLQGTGAAAIALAGLLCGWLAARVRVRVRVRVGTGRSLLFWLSFHGLYQALPQYMIGAANPANDVGMAMAWLHLGPVARGISALLAFVAMGLAGRWLAPLAMAGVGRGWTLAAALALAWPMILPFRTPRHWIEVAVVPLFALMAGGGWLMIAMATRRKGAALSPPDLRPAPTLWGPLAMLGGLLLLFQLVLRPGIAF